MRFIGALLGLISTAAGGWVIHRLVQVARYLSKPEPGWDAGRAASSEEGLKALFNTMGVLWAAAGLVGLFCLLGLVASLRAMARSGGGKILMRISACFLLVGAGAAAAVIYRLYPPPEGLNAAKVLGGMVAAPALGYIVASFFTGRRKPKVPPYFPASPMPAPGPAPYMPQPATPPSLDACPRCGKQLEASQRFCPQCGAQLQGR